MAPMFLVSNVEMLIEAAKNGICGAIPALNWRDNDAMEQGISRLKKECPGPFGINLIVNKSNIRFEEQLDTCVKHRVDFIITSLGSPELCIKKAHEVGIKVFCDVTDLHFAQKVEQLGADAIIAVNREAGGHAGNIPAQELIPLLSKHCRLPIISAGGIGDGKGIKTMLSLGASGVSMGSIFIASNECGVSKEYKQAIVDFGKDDIVMTTKLSGTPCTVINTDYVKKIGTKQNALERLLNHNKRLKKWVKMLTFYRGMKGLEKAAFSATYKTLWCAGPSIEFVKEVKPIATIIDELVKPLIEAHS